MGYTSVLLILILIEYYGTSLQNDEVSWIKKFRCYYWAEHTAADHAWRISAIDSVLCILEDRVILQKHYRSASVTIIKVLLHEYRCTYLLPFWHLVSFGSIHFSGGSRLSWLWGTGVGGSRCFHGGLWSTGCINVTKYGVSRFAWLIACNSDALFNQSMMWARVRAGTGF